MSKENEPAVEMVYDLDDDRWFKRACVNLAKPHIEAEHKELLAHGIEHIYYIDEHGLPHILFTQAQWNVAVILCNELTR